MAPYAIIACALLAALGAVLLRRPEWALAGLCLASPIGLFYIGPAQLITVLAIAVIGVMIGSRWSAGMSPFPRNALTAAAGLWIITVVLSVAFSPYLPDVFLFGIWLIVSALLAVAVTGIVDTRDRLRPVLAAWLVSVVVVTVAGRFISPAPITAAEASAEYGGAVITGRATSVFGQPNEFGTYCMLMCLIALGVAFRARGWLRWLGVVAAVASTIGMVQSYSRAAWVGWVVGLLVLLVIEPRSRVPLVVGGGCMVLGFLGLVAAVPTSQTVQLVDSRIGSIAAPQSNPNDNRPELVAEGFRQFEAAPVFGVGPNAYSIEGATSRSLERTVGGLHPHNIVLTVAAEQGAAGLIATAVFAGVLLVAAIPVLPVVIRRRSRGRDPGGDWVAGLLAGGVAALSAMLVEGTADAPLRNALMRTTLWLIVGFTMSAALVLRNWGTGTEPALSRADRAGSASEPPPSLPTATLSE